jgi:nitrite reductase (NADH) small subunit
MTRTVPASRAATPAAASQPSWVPVCRYADLEPERGVAALVDGVQVALFRLHDGTLAALDHQDPFCGANVMARGLVGSRGDAPTVASPMYKQVFDLRTGSCLDEPAVALRVHAVRVVDGVVQVAVTR